MKNDSQRNIPAESGALDFIPGFMNQSSKSPADLLLILTSDTLLFTADGQIPTRSQAEHLLPPDCEVNYIGRLRSAACYYCALSSLTVNKNDFKSLDLRTVLLGHTTPVFHLCCRALHVSAWRKKHCYCGMCAKPLADKTDELARQCTECGLIVYPRISPAVIVAVVRGNSILLARGKRWKYNVYSVIAGFTEPGETLEGCVHREVYEETRITVKNIRYFGSQPWPLPDSLMTGFTADYAGGELCIDELELETAGWFTADNMPCIPEAPSISRKLIC